MLANIFTNVNIAMKGKLLRYFLSVKDSGLIKM